MQLIGPFPLLIAGLVLRFATSLHTLGDVFIWIGGGLIVRPVAFLIIVALIAAVAGTATKSAGRRF